MEKRWSPGLVTGLAALLDQRDAEVVGSTCGTRRSLVEEGALAPVTRPGEGSAYRLRGLVTGLAALLDQRGRGGRWSRKAPWRLSRDPVRVGVPLAGSRDGPGGPPRPAGRGGRWSRKAPWRLSRDPVRWLPGSRDGPGGPPRPAWSGLDGLAALRRWSPGLVTGLAALLDQRTGVSGRTAPSRPVPGPRGRGRPGRRGGAGGRRASGRGRRPRGRSPRTTPRRARRSG